MPVTVTMPQLGESVTEGTITRWLKAVGDTVAADEPLLEVSTDKVDTEIPAPASGVLLSIDAAEDDTVDVGGVLAHRPSRANRPSRPHLSPLPRIHPKSPPHRQKLHHPSRPRLSPRGLSQLRQSRYPVAQKSLSSFPHSERA